MDSSVSGNLDPSNRPEIYFAVLGASAGAVLAVVVYALFTRRRRPLNWFEKDLLDRVAEEEKSSREQQQQQQQHALANLHPSMGVLGKQSSSASSRGAVAGSDDESWQPPRDAIFNNRVREARDVGRHLSECSCDEGTTGSSVSPLAPPLPGGALVASDERMVIIRSLPLSSSCSNGSADSCSLHAGRLSSTDSDDISCPRSANETRGELEMSFIYDAPQGLLTVQLVEARELRARDLSETADPYAKVRLLPDRSVVKQTKNYKQTLNPEFIDEVFAFEVAPNCSLAERTLEVLLYDFDASSKHRNLGYVQIPLSTVSNLGLEPRTVTKSVLRYGAEGRFKVPSLGELMVSLSYQPSAERLTVIVIRARNLPMNDESGAATFVEPYVQVNVIRDSKSLKKKKTNIRREGTSPVWSESLNFDLAPDVLAECSLHFTIYRANGELLARCEVSEVRQRELFHRVLAGAGASAQWLPLSEPEKIPEAAAAEPAKSN